MKKSYLALGGLFACLHLLFLLFAKVVVGSELLLVLLLPLLSTIYTLKCEKRSVAMFIIATFLICFAFDLIGTFIYVIPSLMCGTVYGLLRKKECKELELLCISGMMHVLSIAFSFFVIVFLFKEVDFMAVFEKIFSLSGESLVVVSLMFLIVLGFSEAFLVHVITDNELAKLSFKVEKNDFVPKWFVIPCVISLFLFVVMSFFNNLYSVFPMIVFFVFFIPYIVQGVMNFKYKVLTVMLCAFLSFLGILLLPHVHEIGYLMIPVLILSPFVINNFGDNREKNF